jgi:hypothetical protein
MSNKAPKHGDLRVWWIPQIPMAPFHVPVTSIDEATKILNVLADYDLFQYKNIIKPDYANMGGLNVFDANDTEDSPDGWWLEWSDDEGNDIHDVMRKAELKDAPRTT